MADGKDQHEPQRRWNNRPESTIAQNFAADLDSMFGLSSTPSVETLTRTVDEKKQTVYSGEQQLQELEAKLRAAEERLARVSRHNSPSRRAPQPQASTSADGKAAVNGAQGASPLAQSKSLPTPSAGPGTDGPGNSEQTESNEYVVVEGDR